jgi:acetyl-CoA carboxylase biotin carboxyl carrier protein
MLKVQEIREIIKLIDQSSIDEFVYESEGTKVKLKKNRIPVSTEVIAPKITPVTGQVSIPVQEITLAPTKDIKESFANDETKESLIEDSSLQKITSPMVGTFYQSSSPETPAYVQVGDKVKENAVVCIVEAMKLFNEIEAEVTGEVVEILVKDGQLVEYGQPLFLVKAN